MNASDGRPGVLNPLVCHVNLDRGFRGGERQTELLIRELSTRNWPQRLVLRRGAVLGQRLAGVPGLEIRYCSGLLSAASKIGRPGLVHVHQGRAVYAAYLRKLLSGIPYLVTRRVPNPLGQGWLTRRAYAGAARLVAISRAVARSMANDLSLDPQSMPLVHSAFDPLPTDAAAAARLRETWAAEFVGGNVGALDHSHKGQGDLIRVASEFAQGHPGIHFVFVGSGRDEEEFRARAAGLKNVHFEGFQEAVGDYLEAFDLFAFPSLKEGMGSVLLDAMDHGLPVVATDVGGIPEVVVDGETGILVPASDPARLGKAILELVESADLRLAMGRAGKKRSIEFSSGIMAERYIPIYREICGG